MARALTVDDLKRRVQAEIDRHAGELVRITKSILKHPETGFKEVKTSRMVSETFKRLGLQPRDGIAITGVKARMDGAAKGPNVVVMGELDSNIVPDHPLADKETGAAHACGHPCQIGSMLGVAFGLTADGVLPQLSGSVTYIAAPAEEYLELEWRMELRSRGKIEFLGGKPELIRLGELDDADICMLTHTSPELKGFGIAETNNGMVGKTVRFRGRAAHAGGAPHLGINALNAAQIALAAIHAQRETFKDEDHIRVHPIITKGGSVVNAVPDDVRMETYVRGASVKSILEANERVDRALRAGALATGATVEIATAPGYLPLNQHAPLADIWERNAAALVGEEAIASIGHRGGSTDMGDVSHLVPTIHPYVGGTSGRGHSEDYMIEDFDLAVVKAAKAMAATVVELLADGADAGRGIVSGFKAPMTRKQYLALTTGLFNTQTYSE